MNQRQKNIRQLIFFGLLVLMILVVVILDQGKKGTDFEKDIFTLGQNTVITTVILEGPEFTNRFGYTNGAWTVNSGYLMDEGMRDVFFALLSTVEVQRPVASSEKDSIASYLQVEGVKVTVLNNYDTVKTYIVGGKEDRFQTYFMEKEEGQPYLIHLPGYQSYIAGMYYATENDWRSRYIWDIDWTSLKKLTIDFKDQEDPLIFEYETNFMTVEGINQLDTSAMMSYLEYIAYLQTDKYLVPGEIPAYDDAIASTEPKIRIDVEQIGDRQSSLLLFNSPAGKQYLPAILNGEQLMLFQGSTIESITAKASDFELSE